MTFTPEVIAECQRIMRIVARPFVRPGVQLDDLVSCAWLRVCMHIEVFDEHRSKFETFVSRQARYAMLDYTRELYGRPRFNRSQVVELTDRIPVGDHAFEVERRIDIELLLRKVGLSDQERQAVGMRLYSWELSDIGMSLGVGEARAHQLVWSAARKMADAA